MGKCRLLMRRLQQQERWPHPRPSRYETPERSDSPLGKSRHLCDTQRPTLQFLEDIPCRIRYDQLGHPSWVTTRLHAGGAMTCGYKRKEPSYLLAPARLPAIWREDEPGLGAHVNAFYAPVAISYTSTGIKPVVCFFIKMQSKSPTKILEVPNNLNPL